MSDENKSAAELLGEAKPAKSGAKVSMGVEEIAALVKAAVDASSDKQMAMIAQILLESKKPYRDPKQDVNDEAFRRQDREIQERIRENLKASQAVCPHKQGCNQLSEAQSQLSSFVMHQLDTGLVWGICTNCQKQIFSNHPEDRKFFAEKSANRISRAGQRTFMNQQKAIQDGMPTVFEEMEPAAVAQG